MNPVVTLCRMRRDMGEVRKSWSEWPGTSVGFRQAIWVWAALGAVWINPSSGLTSLILIVVGLHGLWHFRATLAAWKNPAGVLLACGVAWAVLSVGWSVTAEGSGRDLLKSTPMALAALAIPSLANRPGRIWLGLLASAGWVTLRLAMDVVRLVAALGWPDVLADARFHQTYLYTHPNVSSMMAGLCVLILTLRAVAGVPGAGRRILLAIGILLNLAYMVVMGSRGPQVALAVMALALPVALIPGWRPRLAMAGMAVLLGIGLWQVAHKVNPRFQDDTMHNFNRRDTIWGHAGMLIRERPLLGYGFGKRAFIQAVYQHPDHRAPRGPIHYPHTHSYWLMLGLQGGRIALGLWSLAWLLLGVRLVVWSARASRPPGHWVERMRARTAPVLLLAGLAFILFYGIVDFPDHAIRQAQFYLAGLAMALTALPADGGQESE